MTNWWFRQTINSYLPESKYTSFYIPFRFVVFNSKTLNTDQELFLNPEIPGNDHCYSCSGIQTLLVYRFYPTGFYVPSDSCFNK